MYKKQFDLTDKVAIITGASKGIGASMARALASFGAQVVVSSRKQEAVDKLAAEIGDLATGIACHVGHAEQLSELVKTTVDKWGHIDILINNAATNPVYGPIAEANGELFDKIINVNVKACMVLSNLCYPIMKARGGGTIINVASVEGQKPSPGLGIYSVSKAALIMLTKSQAKEWGADGIRVNAISPGLIKTKFSSALWQSDEIRQSFERHIASGRIGMPDEMAGLAVFLASDASSYVTGSVIDADGGYMLG